VIFRWSVGGAFTLAVPLSKTTTLSRIICEVFRNRIETQGFLEHRPVACVPNGDALRCSNVQPVANPLAALQVYVPTARTRRFAHLSIAGIKASAAESDEVVARGYLSVSV
jgi:hypothetical protein